LKVQLKTKSYKEYSQITCHIAIWLEEPTSEPMTLATAENGLLEASKSACTLPVSMEIEKWFVRERGRAWFGRTRRATGLIGRKKEWVK
jgi:hypothetical protein